MASLLLFFSKTFSEEFARERQSQPKYKKMLWQAVLAIIFVAAVAATVNDIVRLTARWSGS
jgi:hypothetical protein